MTYERGSFVLCLFPNSDLRTYKNRPALVCQNTSIDTGFPQVIVAAVTTSPSAQKMATRVPVEIKKRTGARSGLLHDSLILLDNLATIPKRVIEKKLGTCGNYNEVENAIKVVFGI